MSERNLFPLIVLFLFSLTLQSGCKSDKGNSEKSNSIAKNVQPSSPIPVKHANTPEEKAYLDNPFIGLTTDGHPKKGLFPIKATGASTQKIQEAVISFLSSLNELQKEKCTYPIDDKEWRRWHNIDIYERDGIALFEMDENQKKLAFGILSASLSVDGNSKAKSIMAMEGYLKEVSIQLGNLNKAGIERLGDDKYYFTFMGVPSDNEPWGWQIDGHHLVINFFVLGDQVVMTPTFMGSELTFIKDGPNAGIRTFVYEGKMGLSLYRSLDQNQKALATLLDEKKYNYSRTEAFRDNEVVPNTGIRVNEFNESQKILLIELIEEYVGNMSDDHAKIRMQEVLSQLENTWFSWIGGSGDDDVFYYRIQSPVIMIEFDHHSPVFVIEQGKKNDDPVNWHVHTVVRTPNGNDYGKDLLNQHLEAHHHN